MKYVKLLILMLCFTLVFFSMQLITFDKTFASTNKNTEINMIDIVTTPEKVLFDITNLKPGDWAVRSVVVTNKGEQDFNYITTSSLKGGSDKLYKELLLSISDDSTEIYNGKLSEFKKLEPRQIDNGKTDELFFKITFPTELGNDYQGLWCEVEFKYYVEGTLGGVIPVDGPKLPITGTNIYTYILAGIVLIGIGGMLLIYYRTRKFKSDY